uniref:Lipocalin/cytosolic fatty-acid binding domain-containing protein n=1 Tax=Ascaris lumbricoides TaxID=6252 RepID=A0A9J2Q872_ASCLU
MSTEKLIGKWTFLDSENFDAYMKQCGVGLITRKMAVTLKPSLTISCENGKWKIVSESTFKTIVVEFELDKEFEETTGDGRKLMSKFTIEGDKLIQEQKAIKPGDKDSRFERYIDENGHLIIVSFSFTLILQHFTFSLRYPIRNILS